MDQTNEGLNTARMVANNGQDFFEDTSTHTGVWYGFMPHKDGCKIDEVTMTNDNGDTITQASSDVTWNSTTLDLDSFMASHIIRDTKANRTTKGYITSVKLASGAGTFYRDTLAK